MVIKPAAGYHMNEEFPDPLKEPDAAGRDLAKAQLSKADAAMSRVSAASTS